MSKTEEIEAEAENDEGSRTLLSARHQKLSDVQKGIVNSFVAEEVIDYLEGTTEKPINSTGVVSETSNPIVRNLGPSEAGKVLSVSEDLGFLEEIETKDRGTGCYNYKERDPRETLYSEIFNSHDRFDWLRINEEIRELDGE